MLTSEVAELLATIKDSFPHAKYGPKAIQTFTKALQPFDAKVVQRAVDRVLAQSEWPPTIAGILKEVYRLAGVPPVDEAWLLVEMEAKMHRPDYDRLHRMAQQALRAIGGPMVVRNTQHIELVRKDFVAAYERLLAEELAEPAIMREALVGLGDGTRGLAGTRPALGATAGAATDRREGVEPSGPRGGDAD